MKPIYNAVEYLDPENVYSYSNQVSKDIALEVYVRINSEKFVDYQKEIFDEFAAEFVDKMKDSSLSSKDVEDLLEKDLGSLNTTLQAFADKLRDIPKCELRGYVQLIIDNTIKVWMIGKTTMLIFRDNKIYSVLENSYKDQSNIDQFSDFIGGELESGDVVLYSATKLSELLDQSDFTDLEQTLERENAGAMLDFLDDTIGSRIDKKDVGFVSIFSITGLSFSSHAPRGKISEIASKYTTKLTGKISSKIDLMKWKKKTRTIFDKYYIMVSFLVLAILFVSFAIFSQFKSEKDNQVQFQSSTGAIITLTIDDIKQDIFEFKTLDPTSDEKSLKYSEILQELSAVEQQGKWQEDIMELKTMLNQDYEEGFMIRTISKLSQFDDERVGRKTSILSFSSEEKTALGEPINLSVDSTINIAGQKAALIGIINESTRGNLVEYNLDYDASKCSISLGKKGMFCITEAGDLFYVGKLGVETMESIDADWPSNIGGIGTYARSIYLFYENPNNLGSALLTRYQNIAGSDTKYQNPSNYSIMVGSGVSLPQKLGGFAIDGNFLAWGDGKLYQFWRSSNMGSSLDMRIVEMLGGDKVSSRYSENVKVIATSNSPFVYLLDKDNQTFTVYESSPTKAHDGYKTSFKLYYLFRFKFDLSGENGERVTVVDAVVPESSGDRPELYLLSTEGVNKINLYDFIDSLKANKNLKVVDNAE